MEPFVFLFIQTKIFKFKFSFRKPQDTDPEVDFMVSGQGVTVYSGRFHESRFLEWDIKGRCPKCKTSNVDINFFVTGDGIELHSS